MFPFWEFPSILAHSGGGEEKGGEGGNGGRGRGGGIWREFYFAESSVEFNFYCFSFKIVPVNIYPYICLKKVYQLYEYIS